ncbi:MAG: C40 family peptidase [Alphaproteobacteria bacterium]|nr:C40 family peptidase [Alphaproteobacteria bacterium]
MPETPNDTPPPLPEAEVASEGAHPAANPPADEAGPQSEPNLPSQEDDAAPKAERIAGQLDEPANAPNSEPASPPEIEQLASAPAPDPDPNPVSDSDHATDPAPAAHLPRPLARSGPLDPRRHAFRPDLAADNLRGQVEADRFVGGDWGQVIVPSVQIRNRPGLDAPVDTEALYGEIVVVYDIKDGWAWLQLLRDGYVGYAEIAALTDVVEWPTHRVKALGTFIYPDPDIKKPPIAHLSLNSAVSVVSQEDQFYRLSNGGYITIRHLAEEESFARDFVDVAERFMGTPYLWGGRTRLGIDCSGLVQVALEAAGISAPRDSDMQRDELGTDLLIPEDYEGLHRGDLVFWPGHVGIMADGIMLLHANAHHMAVTIEPLPEAVERIARASSRPTAIKRLKALCA